MTLNTHIPYVPPINHNSAAVDIPQISIAIGAIGALEPPPVEAFKGDVLARPLTPHDLPDPCVLRAHGTYWVYATNSVALGNVPLLQSSDLEHYSYVGDAMPVLPAWAEIGLTWAPEVTALPAGGYVLYFTTRLRGTGLQVIGVAFADEPQGPFTAAERPLIEMRSLGGVIDAATLVRSDGSAYLYWKNDGNAIGLPTVLWGAELSPRGHVTGSARPLLVATQACERRLVEAPQVIEDEEHFHLIYACGDFGEASYTQRHAVGDSPLGPFRKSDAPLLECSRATQGPGHACAFRDHTGQWRLMYHAWTPHAIGYRAGGKRTLRLSKLHLRGERAWAAGS